MTLNERIGHLSLYPAVMTRSPQLIWYSSISVPATPDQDKRWDFRMKAPRIGICLTATGRYIGFFPQLYDSIERHFFRHSDKSYFLFTDARRPFPRNVRVVETERLGFPGDTLYRCHRIHGIRDHLREQSIDVLYQFDMDMRVVCDIGHEFLPSPARPLLAVVHPGFHQDPSGGGFERNLASTACIGLEESCPCYVTGAIFGGLAEPFLSACARMKAKIDIDDRRGVMAVWHDESHLNRYVASHPDLFTLMPPDYYYPEGWRLEGCRPKILALDKDHDWYRSLTDTKRVSDAQGRFPSPAALRRGLGSLLRSVLPERTYSWLARWRKRVWRRTR